MSNERTKIKEGVIKALKEDAERNILKEIIKFLRSGD